MAPCPGTQRGTGINYFHRAYANDCFRRPCEVVPVALKQQKVLGSPIPGIPSYHDPGHEYPETTLTNWGALFEEEERMLDTINGDTVRWALKETKRPAPFRVLSETCNAARSPICVSEAPPRSVIRGPAPVRAQATAWRRSRT